MKIRPAAPTDLPAIAAIWNLVIRESLATFNSVERSVRDLEAMLDLKASANHAFLVAELDDRIAGFATYGQFRGGVGYARTMEHTIILAPFGRGRGLGRALMAEIERHARDNGAHSMFAGVSSGNQQGISFHAALGYAECARLREVGFKWGQWLDLVLMQKFL